MPKTKPIGVRFDEDMLAVLKKEHSIDSPQKALNFLFNYWRMNRGKINPMAGVPRRVEDPIIKGNGNQVPVKIKSETPESKIPDNYASLSRTEKMKFLKK